MLIVISPAKDLDFTAPIPQILSTQPEHLDQSQTLVEILRKFEPKTLSQLMHISDRLAILNVERWQTWRLPFDDSNSRPALWTFAGDVYRSMDAHSFTPSDIEFAQSHLRILSGLYGILRPLDLIQAYRLEMGTALANPRGNNLYDFWGDRLAKSLNLALQQNSHDSYILNLASNEYFKAISGPTLEPHVIQPVFLDWQRGQFRQVSLLAKRARGLMCAYIVKNRLLVPEAIQAFNGSGYRFDPARSSPQQWIFTRKSASP